MLSPHCESMLSYAAGRRAVLLDHRRYRPNVEVAPSCPRCDSPNTKFCYYNNYSLSQPRYFCKGCRRYWTKGGSLRNVPVGGGCRKNRRGRPVRAAAAVDAAGGAGGGGAAAAAFSSHRPAAFSSLRPDVLLEGMVGGGGGLCQPVAAADDKPAEGPTIDLALLYAKFLNHQPPPPVVGGDQGAVAPESLDTKSLSSSSDITSPNAPPPPDQPFATGQDGLGELPAPASADPGAMMAAPRCPEPLGELGFTVDQSCYDSLGLPADGGDLVLPSTWHQQEAKYEPFDPLPEDAMGLHDENGIAGADDVWSNALACQGLEAALCRP